jgi:hypothetical protein
MSDKFWDDEVNNETKPAISGFAKPEISPKTNWWDDEPNEKPKKIIKKEPKSLMDFMQTIPSSPGGPPVIPSLMEGLKGVPILGPHIPQTEAMTQLEQEHPTKAGFQRFAGGLTSTAPLAMGVGNITRPFGVGADMAGQGMLGASLSGGNEVSRKAAGQDVTSKDILLEMLKGGGLGAAGAALPKLISPGNPPPPSVGTKFSKPASDLERLEAELATETKVHNVTGKFFNSESDDLHHLILRGLMGAGSGGLMGLHPMMDVALATAGAVAPHIPRAFGAYAHNTLAQNPSTKDLINILMQSQNTNAGYP